MEVRNKLITGTTIVGAIALTIIFDLTRLHLAVALGLVIFVGSVIEDGFTGTEGRYILLLAGVLFIASFGIAYMSEKSLFELANDSNTPYLLRSIPFYATATGIWGVCLVVRSFITGRYHRKVKPN